MKLVIITWLNFSSVDKRYNPCLDISKSYVISNTKKLVFQEATDILVKFLLAS